MEAAERSHILKALEACGWRVSGKGGAAELLGLRPSTLDFRIEKLAITRPAIRWRTGRWIQDPHIEGELRPAHQDHRPLELECNLFCNQPGAKTRAHFDPVDTLALQLKGHKRWRIAPNALAPQPTANWTTLDGSEGDAELWLYAHGELPTRIPEGAEDYLLGPGAMLYVPRGYWHETESDEPSVSLHLHHVSLPWVDAMLVSLRALLLRDPAWREGALGLWGSEGGREGEREIGRRLRALVEAAARLAPGDVLPAPARASRQPRLDEPMLRRARAGFAVEAPGAGASASKVTFVAADYGVERRTTVEMSTTCTPAASLSSCPRASPSRPETSPPAPPLSTWARPRSSSDFHTASSAQRRLAP